MQLIPSREEQSWLIDRLAGLLNRFAGDRLADGPVLDYAADIEPVADATTPEQVAVLTRRFLRHAGLDDFDLEIELAPPQLLPGGAAHVWWELPAPGPARLLLDLNLPRTPRLLAQCLAWFAAVVFSAARGPGATDPEEGALLADLVALYLGFGGLRLDTDFHFGGSEFIMGGPGLRAADQPFELEVGLPLSSRAFLFAAQGIRRGWDAAAVRLIRGRLGADQAACFEACWAELAPWRAELTERLAPIGTGGEPAPPSPPFGTPVENAPPARIVVVSEEASAEDWRDPDRVVRAEAVDERRLDRLWFVLPAAAAAFLCHRFLGLQPPGCAFIVIVALFLGIRFSTRIVGHRCSEPSCGETLRRGLSTCPGCGARVAWPDPPDEDIKTL